MRVDARFIVEIMLPLAPETLLPLGIVTIIGIGFTFFGYTLANQLLRWIGSLLGAGCGAAAGWFFLLQGSAEATVQSEAIGLLALFAVGAIAGRILVPLFSRLFVVFISFTSTTGAVLILLAGTRITNAISNTVPDTLTLAEINEMMAQLSALPLFHEQRLQQFFAIALVAGVLGVIIASKFYQTIITGVVTAIGAALLGVVGPLWQQALSGGVSFGGGLSPISPLWFAVVLMAGIVFQLHRYGSVSNSPFVGKRRLSN